MLELKNISFETKSGGEVKQILKNISFKFEDGKNYVITGENGSGKSTLAKIIMGINQISSGKIIFNKNDITSLGITERANSGIAFSLQQPVRFKGLTVKTLLELASGETMQINKACDTLSKVGLCAKDYIDRELNSTLSGGELKRIEIASVLARDAKLNIFDEPEAGIDIWSFNGLVNIFKNSKNTSTTNIIISHQEKIFKNADEIILLSGGKIISHGPPSEMLKKINSFNSCKKLEVK